MNKSGPRICTALVITLAGAFGAMAQNCERNFKSGGVPIVSGIRYQSWDLFPGLGSAKALGNLPQSVAAEGFSSIRVDQAGGVVTGLKDGAGTGRPQSMRVTIKKVGNVTRVDAIYELQSGQLALEDQVRAGLCRIIAGARS